MLEIFYGNPMTNRNLPTYIVYLLSTIYIIVPIHTAETTRSYSILHIITIIMPSYYIHLLLQEIDDFDDYKKYRRPPQCTLRGRVFQLVVLQTPNSCIYYYISFIQGNSPSMLGHFFLQPCCF